MDWNLVNEFVEKHYQKIVLGMYGAFLGGVSVYYHRIMKRNEARKVELDAKYEALLDEAKEAMLDARVDQLTKKMEDFDK